MSYFYKIIKKNKVRGFVLPFTIFVCSIMILLSGSIATILQKQFYFSNLFRKSQSAYYTAGIALACVMSIDKTYDMGVDGLYPYSEEYLDNGATSIFPVEDTNDRTLYGDSEIEVDMDNEISDISAYRITVGDTGLSPLATDLYSIKCAQSDMFGGVSNYTVRNSNLIDGRFEVTYEGAPLVGLTSTFNMRMDLGDGEFRCAKVTVSKAGENAKYRQYIAQGYSSCDLSKSDTVERAIVNTTVSN